MKKRKFGLAAIMLALLLCLACVFAACDDDPVTPTPPPEGTEGEETVVEQVPVPTTPGNPPAGSVRVTFAGGVTEVVPDDSGEYAIAVDTDFPGDGTLELTVSQANNEDIAFAAEGEAAASATLTKAFTAETQPAFSATLTDVAVGDISLRAVYKLTGQEAVNCDVTQSLSILHTMEISPTNEYLVAGLQPSVALTADASFSETNNISWEIEGDADIQLGTSTGASVTATLQGGAVADETATVTATYTYTTAGGTERTLQDTATLTVKAATSQVPGAVSEKLIAFADFDLDPEGSGADVMLARGTNASGVTATYSTNSTQSGTAHNGNAFVMTPGKNTAPYITFSFDGLELTDGDGLAISFWVQNGTDKGDWSTIAEAANGSGKGGRIQFMNISVDISTANGNRFPGSGGVLTGSAVWDDLIDNTEWAYITVVANNVGVYFYENGELLCTYADTDAANVWDAFMYQINDNGTIKFFGNNESSVNFYIDDLLLTTGLDADGVAALYAAVSGTAEA